MSAQAQAPDLERFLKENPLFLALLGLAVLGALQKTVGSPKYLKGCPSPNQRLAGPWRGKGSFGRGFGPQGSRR